MNLPHRRGYANVAEAMRSKAFTTVPGAVIDDSCPCGRVHVTRPGAAPAVPPQQRRGLRAVSPGRQAENRRRRAVVAELWPDGRPRCEWPGCTRLADDVHEKLTRARGGSITDRANLAALCRPHHDHVTFTPESELAAAYEAGLLVHSWDAPGGAS